MRKVSAGLWMEAAGKLGISGIGSPMCRETWRHVTAQHDDSKAKDDMWKAMSLPGLGLCLSLLTRPHIIEHLVSFLQT